MLNLVLVLPELGLLGAMLGFNPDALLRPLCSGPPVRRQDGTAYPLALKPGVRLCTQPFMLGGSKAELGFDLLDGGRVGMTLPSLAPTLIGDRIERALPGRVEGPKLGSRDGVPGAYYILALRRGDRFQLPLQITTIAVEVN